MTTKYCRWLGGKGEGVVKVTRLGWLRSGAKVFLNGGYFKSKTNLLLLLLLQIRKSLAVGKPSNFFLAVRSLRYRLNK